MAREKKENQMVLIDRCMLFHSFGNDTMFSRVLDVVKGNGITQVMCDALCYLEGKDVEEPVLDIDGKEIKADRVRPWADEYETSHNQRNVVYSAIAHVKAYLEHGIEIVGIIGSNLSPRCGKDGEEGDYPFVDAVREQLKEEGIDIPVLDIQCEDDLDKVRALFE